MPTKQNFNMYATKKAFFQNCSIITVFVVVVVVVACLLCFVLLGILIAWHLLKINRRNGSEN